MTDFRRKIQMNYPFLADVRVDLSHSDDPSHDLTQPLGFDEVDIPELLRGVIVVKQDTGLMEESHCLHSNIYKCQRLNVSKRI